MPSIKKTSRILLSAGESSGDLLAAQLFEELSSRAPYIEASGITGPKMSQAGVKSLDTIEKLSVMGITGVLKKLPQIKMFFTELLEKIDRCNPKLAILVDSPSFHLLLGEQLRLRGIRTMMYVAPQLWAWGQNRAYTLKEQVDHLLGILPFETKFFAKYKIPYTYVGSPVYERILKIKIAEKKTDPYLLGFFPGSRSEEFAEMFPLMCNIATILAKDGYRSVINVAPSLSPYCIQETISKYRKVTPSIIKDFFTGNRLSLGPISIEQGNTLELMSIVNFALVTSGTACLECALLETPLAMVYRTSKLNFFIGSRLVKVPYLSLPNLVAGQKIIEEFVQDLDVKSIAKHIKDVCEGEQLDELQLKLKHLKKQMYPYASKKAAAVILSHC